MSPFTGDKKELLICYMITVLTKDSAFLRIQSLDKTIGIWFEKSNDVPGTMEATYNSPVLLSLVDLRKILYIPCFSIVE